MRQGTDSVRVRMSKGTTVTLTAQQADFRIIDVVVGDPAGAGDDDKPDLLFKQVMILLFEIFDFPLSLEFRHSHARTIHDAHKNK